SEFERQAGGRSLPADSDELSELIGQGWRVAEGERVRPGLVMGMLDWQRAEIAAPKGLDRFGHRSIFSSACDHAAKQPQPESAGSATHPRSRCHSRSPLLPFAGKSRARSARYTRASGLQ